MGNQPDSNMIANAIAGFTIFKYIRNKPMEAGKRIIKDSFYKLHYLVFILLFSLANSSCTMLLLKLTGNIKNPQLEDNESIKKYCQKNKDPYDLLWVANDKENFEELITRYPGIPTVLIYDRNYLLLENANGEACQKMLISFFSDSLKYKYKKSNDSSYTYIKSKTRVVDSSLSLLNSYDYIVIYVWAEFTPKIAKDLFTRLDRVKRTDKRNICFISLNKDWPRGMYSKAPRLNGKVHNDGNANAPRN